MGGASRCEGALDVNLPDLGWRPVAGNDFNLKMAKGVCAQFNCGSALSATKKAGSERQQWAVQTECGDSSQDVCFDAGSLFISSRVEIKCSGKERNYSKLCFFHFQICDVTNPRWSRP